MTNKLSNSSNLTLRNRGGVYGLTIPEFLLFPLFIILFVLFIVEYKIKPPPTRTDHISEIVKQFIQLERKFTTVSEQLVKTEKELSSKSEEFTQLESKFTATSEQLIKTEKELSSKSEEFTQLESKFTTTSEQLDKTEKELLSRSEEFTGLASKFTTTSEQLDKTEKEFLSRSDEFTGLASEFSDISMRLNQTEEGLSSKTEQFTQLESRYTEIIDQLAQTVKKLSAKSEEFTQLMNKHSIISGQITLLRSESKIKSSKLSELAEQINILVDQQGDLNDKIIELQRDLNQHFDDTAPPTFTNGFDKMQDLSQFIDLNDKVSRLSFDVGKATLSEDFESYLKDDIVSIIKSLSTQSGAKIIEVVGHADEQPYVGGTTNFDNDIIKAFEGSLPISKVNPTDNAGLGIARAVAVIEVLRQQGQLSDFKFLPLSGAQLNVPATMISETSQSGDNIKRRRIEIRIRK